MIVNTAYPFMTKRAPANPIIFDRNVVNYTYQGSATLTQWGFSFSSMNNVTFYGVNCRSRKTLNITGESSAIGFNLRLTVKFLKNGEQVSAGASFPNGTTTQTVEVPEAYRTDGVTVILTADTLAATLLLTSATLS